MAGSATRDGSELFSRLHDSLGHLVRRTQQMLTSVWSETVHSGVTATQYAVLAVVSAFPGISQQDLGERAFLERSATADVVARLQRNCWMDRRRDPADARRTVLTLTPPALVALPTLTAQAEQAQATLFAVLDPLEQVRLSELLRRVAFADGEDAAAAEMADPASPVLSLEGTPMHLLRRIEQRQHRIWAEIVGKLATPTQYAVFCALRRETLDQKTVGMLASLDTSNAADVISRLRSQSLLQVTTDEGDRRRKLVGLTPAALDLLADLTPRALQVHEALSAPLGPQEVREVLDLLARVSFTTAPEFSRI